MLMMFVPTIEPLVIREIMTLRMNVNETQDLIMIELEWIRVSK